MNSMAAEIKAALAYYRKVSAKRNKRLLGVYIDAITKAESTDELTREETNQEDWKEEQINAVRYLVDAELDDLRIFKPPDLLDRFDRFAAMPSLDGTSHGILLPESRAETAAAYFDTLDAAEREVAREGQGKRLSPRGVPRSCVAWSWNQRPFVT